MTLVAPRTKEERARLMRAALTQAWDELVATSLEIHAHPELNYEEYHAAALLADLLERHGFAVERGGGGVATAFRAVVEGAGPGPTIAYLAEYDALPEIGHGCGHNLIAISAVAAGLAEQAANRDLPGRIVVLGTPAEEGGGGKIRLLEAGVFAGVDVALSSHPGSHETVIPTEIPLGESWSLAMVGYRYEFVGRAAHAAVSPHEGVNALNAVIHLFTGIDALRQHLRDDVRIHGVITDGGKAPNVVPEFAAANFMLRARDREYLLRVVEQVRQVAEGAALMTGAQLTVKSFYPFYEHVVPNATLARLAWENAPLAQLAVVAPRGPRRGWASTDFGNVSQVVPAFAISFAVSETPVAAHTPAMAAAATTELAHRNAIAVGLTLALLAADLRERPELLAAVREEFLQRTGREHG
ncbi:MAG: amidohydrolase [Chloroflexi bacterium]|nr:amidohydrolase [Chloroflexota bacterium]